MQNFKLLQLQLVFSINKFRFWVDVQWTKMTQQNII